MDSGIDVARITKPLISGIGCYINPVTTGGTNKRQRVYG